MATTTKSRGPRTPELLKTLATGTVRLEPVFGAPLGQKPVIHEPRTKYDPQPWTDGFFRYHAWELCAVALTDDE